MKPYALEYRVLVISKENSKYFDFTSDIYIKKYYNINNKEDKFFNIF